MITIATWVTFAVVSIVVAYGLGKGPVEEYTYVMGLPLWWFASIIVTIIFTFIVIGITMFVFKDMDLNDVVYVNEKKK